MSNNDFKGFEDIKPLEGVLLDYFCSFVKIDTTSDPNSSSYPSTETQNLFAEVLAGHCSTLGLSDVSIDKYGYVFATLPSNLGDDISSNNIPTIGFVAHMDTSPDYSGKGVLPNIIECYDGNDINLKNNVVISPSEFKSLNNYVGKKLITADGTTLLGADDKAGIAEIFTAFKFLLDNPELKHGDIRLAFTPDEEIGQGTKYFDVKKFNCDFAYTLDGGGIGELNYENFNASGAKINITGKNVHPGSAKNIMVNSAMVANELISMLPNEMPSNTEKREGFFHLTHINGNIEKTNLGFIIRTFDEQEFQDKNDLLKNIVKYLNGKYNNCIELDLNDSYYNMYNILKDNMHIVEKAQKSMKKAGVEPKIVASRGGTDGACLTYMGLPCPNIFTGGHNYHGPYEYICVESMLKAVEVVVNIALDI